MVITAPGAGGKSAAAEAIASLSGAPLVDLSKLQVGSDTLVGLLTRVLGWTQAADFVNSLRAGEGSLVLDSLDEAQLLAGRENYLAFLQNIVTIIRDAKPCKQIILLGRREAAKAAMEHLEQLGVKVENWVIRPLFYSLATQLIDSTLDTREERGQQKYIVHRTHPVPFGKYRDRIFSEIAQALGAKESSKAEKYWPEVESFLGYPPVLMVLAEKLAVDNPDAALQSGTTLQGSGNRTSQGALLRQIVEGLLDREHEKVRAHIAKSLGLPDEVSNQLYLREEQALHILKHLSGLPVKNTEYGMLDPANRSAYEDLIQPFIPDHPFISAGVFGNIVFSDYVRAFIATSPTIETCGASSEELLSLIPAVGPFFVHFVYALTQDIERETPEGQTTGSVTEDVVDSLIRSHALGGSGRTMAMYKSSEESALDALILSDFEPPNDVYNLAFDVDNQFGILELSSPISHCMILGKGGLVFNPVNGEIEIGPNFFAICEEIDLKGNRFVAIGGPDQAGVFLMASSVQHATDLRVFSYPESALRASWKDMWHQWREYKFAPDISQPYISPQASYEVLFWTRRILSSFRSAVSGRPSIFKDQLDRQIIGNSTVAAATLKGLQELDIVSKDNQGYRLRLDALGSYGVSWTDITGPNFQNALGDLNSKLLRTDSVLSVVARPA